MDSEGLIRVYRDMGVALGGKTLVYVRPKRRPHGKDYMARPDIDGVVIFDGDFASTVEILAQIGLQR
jgi:hypothetical protein